MTIKLVGGAADGETIECRVGILGVQKGDVNNTSDYLVTSTVEDGCYLAFDKNSMDHNRHKMFPGSR